MGAFEATFAHFLFLYWLRSGNVQRVPFHMMHSYCACPLPGEVSRVDSTYPSL